jgi:hypothetical protein
MKLSLTIATIATIMPVPILGHTWTIQAGTTRETIKTVNGNKDEETGRKSNETVHSYLHRHLNRENSHKQETVPAVTRLHSRWSSSSRDVVDKPPSQPLRCRRMSGGRPSSATSVKESHQEDPGTSEVRRLQQAIQCGLRVMLGPLPLDHRCLEEKLSERYCTVLVDGLQVLDPRWTGYPLWRLASSSSNNREMKQCLGTQALTILGKISSIFVSKSSLSLSLCDI